MQTNPWHRVEEPHSNHEAPGRQTKIKCILQVPILETMNAPMEAKKSVPHLKVLVSLVVSMNLAQDKVFLFVPSRTFIHSMVQAYWI